MNMNKFYGVAEEDTGKYVIPLSVASFMGPVFFGHYFDSIGRRKMVFITYSAVAFLLTLNAILFVYEIMNLPM